MTASVRVGPPLDSLPDPSAQAPGACPRVLGPAGVLDLHADLHRELAHPSPLMRQIMRDYAVRDLDGHTECTASHLHPAKSLHDLEPWITSLGSDLFGADTYQVTGEMIDLAEALTVTTPGLEDLRAEDLPSDYGFMWFDRPVARPSLEDDGRPPLRLHAVSWARVPAMPVRLPDGQTGAAPAVRVREWGWRDEPDVIPRPLHLMGQSVSLLTPGVTTPLAHLRLVHMVWILMGMEITAATRAEPGRAGRKRAANLRHTTVNVITLRRPAHGDPAEPEGGHRPVDWTCSWLVRGHHRHVESYPGARHPATGNAGQPGHCDTCHARVTWVRPHIKDPAGLPLRAADILYKLSR